MKKVGIVIFVVSTLVVITAMWYVATMRNQDTPTDSETPVTDQESDSMNDISPSMGDSGEVTSDPMPSSMTSYTMDEVANHPNQSSCWTVMDGKVYDITSYIPNHPGGIEAILKACGGDGSVIVSKVPAHQKASFETTLAQYQIGLLAQ